MSINPKKPLFFEKIYVCGQNYTLEWFSEAGSAPIRSAVQFYFDIDVRIFFSTSSKNIFSIDQKKSWKSRTFSKSRKFSKKISIFDFLKFWNFEIFDFWDFENFRFFQIFFNFFFSIDRKNIFWRSWEKNPDINIEVKFHCGSNGSTPSLWKPLQSIVSGR